MKKTTCYRTKYCTYWEKYIRYEGGYGSVFLAQSKIDKSNVAIKFIREKMLLPGNILKEMKVLEKLRHPNIIDFHHAFLYNHALVLIMQYASGGELRSYIDAKGTISEQEARLLFWQITSAVRFCHIQKIIHRDLKLENILFENDKKSVIRIVDFGIAGFLDMDDKTRAGSLRYLPPEIVTRARLDANPALDVWSMGCILYALVNGKMPFDGKDTKEIKDKIKKGAYEIVPTNTHYLKQLFASIFTIDFNKRITLEDIMQHPWLLGDTYVPEAVSTTTVTKAFSTEVPQMTKRPSFTLVSNTHKNFTEHKYTINKFQTQYRFACSKAEDYNDYTNTYYCAMDVPQFRRPIHHTKEQKRQLNLIMEITKRKRFPSFHALPSDKNSSSPILKNNRPIRKMASTLYCRLNVASEAKPVPAKRKAKHIVFK